MGIRRIAVSGGPGAGKTTLWRTLSDLHRKRVVAMPEVATLLFSHVFPQVQDELERCAVQRAIFSVQENLERVLEHRATEDRVLLCDRGLPDGAGYWPHGPQHFFETMQTAWATELQRYDAVLFMESAAVGDLTASDNNPTRTEDLAAARSYNERLRAVWQDHPRFEYIPHARDFSAKIAQALTVAERLLDELAAVDR